MISTDHPIESPSAWRRRRRIPLSAVLAWTLAAVGLVWLLVSAVVGLSSLS